MNALDHVLARLAQPSVVLRVAALAVGSPGLAAAVTGLLGFRTGAYDGLVSALYFRWVAPTMPRRC